MARRRGDSSRCRAGGQQGNFGMRLAGAAGAEIEEARSWNSGDTAPSGMQTERRRRRSRAVGVRRGPDVVAGRSSRLAGLVETAAG
jgi:hypothetical protein